MRRTIAAACALAAASSLNAQAVDYTTATPLAGSWTYARTTDGSEATFASASAQPQLTIHCTRLSRQVTIARPASAAAPLLSVWTSSATRDLPASFTPATARLSAQLPAFDALLDAIVYSRGRFAVGVAGSPAVVLPAWPEIARVVEDCRV